MRLGSRPRSSECGESGERGQSHGESGTRGLLDCSAAPATGSVVPLD